MTRSRKQRRQKAAAPPPRKASSVSVLPPHSTTLAAQIYERLEKAGVIEPTKGDGKPTKTQPTIPMGDRHIPSLQEVIARERPRGEANARHYLQQARQTGLPWHQNIRHEHQYSEYVLITVEMAKDALNYNPDNSRIKIRDDHARALARDIKHNHYLPTAESVDFDVRGFLQNGQHRLAAIIIADEPCLIYCTWNVATESKFVIDSGLKRGTADKLRPLATKKINSKTTAVCRACILGVRTRVRITDSEIAEFLMAHEDTIAWVQRQLPNARSDVQAVVVKGALWYGKEAVAGFCEKFYKSIFPTEKDPVRLLSKWLERSRSSGSQVHPVAVYKKALSALEHYINGKELRALYEREIDLFEWGEGYTVPPKFPDK